MRFRQTLFAGSVGVLWSGLALAASVSFTPRELYRIPFGPAREALGTRAENGTFSFPKNFTLDEAGRLYVYDFQKHRVARFSPQGKYQMGFAYPATARQVFAHADSRDNLWLLVSDPVRGVYYGVYDPRGKTLHEAVFSQFNHFQLHLDDNFTLHVLMSSDKTPQALQTYFFHEQSLLLKKENIARPPQDHHEVRQNDRVYFMDAVPGASDTSPAATRIRDQAHRRVADIQGQVMYITARGDVYTRVSERMIHVYDVSGSLKGKVDLTGLASSCAAIRFDADGNLYQLDGIPDASGHYTPEMPGMRFIRWERP